MRPVRDYGPSHRLSVLYIPFFDATPIGQTSSGTPMEQLTFTSAQAPEAMESNWLPTGEDFFLIFRLYGPELALLEKTWTLPDVEKVR
jgi:hypothetical protein